MTITLTVDDNTPRNQYTATNLQTAFTYDYIIFSTADLKVYQNDTLLTLTTHYTVDTINDNDGGTVTLVTGATTGDIITIERDIAVARSSNFQQASNFDPEDLNTEQRTEIAISQQLERDIDRKIGFATTSTATTGTLPDPADGLFLGWDGTDLANLASPVANSLTAIVSNDSYKIAHVNSTEDNLEYLAHGTAGQVLTSGGVGATPTWGAAASAGLVFLSETTISNDATVDITSGIDSTYDNYVIELINIVPATTNQQIYLRVTDDGGSTFKAGATDYEFHYNASNSAAGTYSGGNSTGAAQIAMGNVITNGGSASGNITIKLYNPASSALQTCVGGTGVTIQTTSPALCNFAGTYTATAAINGVRFLMASGNLTSGTIRLYGIAKS